MAVKSRKERQLDQKPLNNGQTDETQVQSNRSEENSPENGENSNKYEKVKSNENQNEWEGDEKPAEETSNEKIQKEDSSIFIGNAPVGIKVEKIKAHFIKYAIIYIDFATEEAAKKACEENQKMFEGKRLRVSLARERKPINKEATLFVGNLKYSTSEEQLYDEFIEFGEIDMVRIIAGKGFGFVHFAVPASVDKAAVKNKSIFNGREIHVERSRPPIDKESSSQENIDRAIISQNYLKKQQAPGGYLNYRRNQTRNQLALELLERVMNFHGNFHGKRPKSGIKF